MRQPESVEGGEDSGGGVTSSDSEPRPAPRPAFNRSKSLEAGGRGGGEEGGGNLPPQRSRSCSRLAPEPELERYTALADYAPLSGRELRLAQADTVELVRRGCAGWWFVRLESRPDLQGWAPSTYLQPLDPPRHPY